MSAAQDVDYFEDYYEILDVTPSVDLEGLGRAYKAMVQRYHPDNQQTGDVEKFMLIVKAHEILSNPEMRAAYDNDYRQNQKHALSLFQESEEESYARDKKMFEKVLGLLYNHRRAGPRHSGMGMVQIEQKLGCAASHLEFHMWYLREKGWVERLETGLMAITADGVDRAMERMAVESRERGWFKRPWKSRSTEFQSA